MQSLVVSTLENGPSESSVINAKIGEYVCGSINREIRAMRMEKIGTTVKLWLSTNDTYNWAHRPNTGSFPFWPCSQLAGKRLFAEFDDDDLVNYTVDGKDSVDVPVNEFTAITDDFIAGVRV